MSETGPSDPHALDSQNRRGPIAWMAQNAVAANLLMIVLLVGGFMLTLQIKQELFPDFDLDRVVVMVPYPGASPEEVEQGIVLAIEEAVQGLDNVKEVTSTAGEGFGTVVIEMVTGGDLEKLGQDVQNEVDRITSFPEEAEEPQVTIPARRREVISVVLFGDQPEHILREIAENVRDVLLQDPEITQVDLAGVRPLEISVEVPRANLRRYGLRLEDIARRLREASVELPGGGIKTEAGEVLVRMKDRRDYGREFARIPIVAAPDGTEVVVEDIATVIDGFADVDLYATYNGKSAVMLRVFRVGNETPVSVADAVRKHVGELQGTLPPGIEVDVLSDFSKFYRQRINLLLRNGGIGLVLVLLLLGFFLEARLAFWVTMGIPISFLGAFFILPALGVTINMLSVFAFIIALGIVVDDAIVVGENIYKYHQRGVRFLRAAVLGTREVAMPVTFSVLTNIAAFMPLFFVPGITGKFFRVIPAVVVSVFAISLVESIFILPAHLGHQKERKLHGVRAGLHHTQQRFSAAFVRFVENGYGPFLDGVLRFRYITVAAGVALLTLTIGYVASGRMGMTLFPKVESDFALVTAKLAYGSSAAQTEVVADRVVRAAQEIVAENGGATLAQGIFAQVGQSWADEASGSHIASATVFLTEPNERPLHTPAFVELWRKRVGDIPGLESLSFVSDAGGPGAGGSLAIELSHRDYGVLERASGELARELAGFPKVQDIDDGFSPGKPQVDFRMLAEGRSLGLTARDVASQVRSAYYGAEVLRQQRGRNEIKVMVRLPEAERETEYTLEDMILRTPSGGDVALRDVVDVDRGRAYTTVSRRQSRRIVTVTADVTPRSETAQVVDSLKAEVLPTLASRYRGLSFDLTGQQQQIGEDMQSLGTGLLVALLAIYALLAVPFRSYVQPLIIMVSIPFGIVGAVIGHMIMGYTLSVMSMFGIVALSGVVVNDSLVLIDFANRRRRTGETAHDAVRQAGVLRFRPILLTTLTTFGGLTPMILELSMQARFLIPMAISLGFGVLFATLITLMLVPSLYLVLEDIRRLNPAIRARSRARNGSPRGS